MSRHRDVRNIDLDDYAEDDDYYDDDAGYEEEYDHPVRSSSSTASSASSTLQSLHRAHQAQLANEKRSMPKQIEQSAAFFKTKPAKKGKPQTSAPVASVTVSAPSSSSSASTSSRAPPGFGSLKAPTASASAGFSGEDELDADTAAAIKASIADQDRMHAFRVEAGLSSSPTGLSSSPPSAATPLRSQDAARDTQLALEQLRLEKMRRGQSGDMTIHTPKRQLSADSPVGSPPSRSPPTSSPLFAATPTKIDRPNLPVPTRLPNSLSLNSLSAPPEGSTSQPPTPKTPSSSSMSDEIGDQPPPTVSAKRAKEVLAAEEAEASLAAASGVDTSKSRLNMVVIGHVDAGKSTLMGHLLFLQGRVSKKVLHRYEKESKELGKSSFHFAWVLDETDEERVRGITTDVGFSYFESATKQITLLDAPGHKEFIPNMITGAAQADAAILVVPATKGEFEGGFSEDGQIREHAVLARSLGVSQLILAVNKLDTCGWDETRYNEIVGQMIPYLKSVGYKEKDVWSIPVSGLTGENIMECKEPLLKSWYTGPVLLDLIDRFTPPQRHTDKPLRMCVQDVFKGLTLGQTVCGKIESGTILVKDRLLLLPLGETITVKAMESRGENMTIAKAGDNVEIGIKDFSDPQVLQIITMNYKVPLLQGSQLTFYTQAATEPIVLHSIVAIIDKVSGAVVKKSPRVLPRATTAIVELSSKNKICLELFRSYRELGRFTLRRGNETVAVGITTKLFRLT